MSKRIVLAVAAGVVAGATVIGVPTFAFATASDSGDSAGRGTSGSQMTSTMTDPAFVNSAKQLMSTMMSDPHLQQQMRSMMGGISGTGGAPGGMLGGSPSGQTGSGTP